MTTLATAVDAIARLWITLQADRADRAAAARLRARLAEGVEALRQLEGGTTT